MVRSSSLRRETILVVVFVCSLIGGAYTGDPVSQVFDQCVRESNIPPLRVNSTLLKTILEITQTRGTVESVVLCTEKKIQTMKNSSDAVEWFVGHTFDPAMAREKLNAAVDIYTKVNGSSCLRNSLGPNLQSCLNSLKTGLDAMRLGSSDLENVCRKEIGHCMVNLDSLGMNCSADDKQMARAAATLFYGKCTARWSSLPVPSPVPYMSAIFTCGDQIFLANPLSMLFPPSEKSVLMIDNITAAVEANRASLKTFCSKGQEYSTCLQKGLMTPKSKLDHTLSQLLNPDLIPQMFNHFCMNTDLITSQFECTYTKVKEHRCNGGIFELLDQAAGSTVADTAGLCEHMKSAQRCRLEHQLRPCSPALESKMQVFYKGLRSADCSSDMSIPDQGEFIKCAEPYVKKISEIGNEADIKKNFTGAVAFALKHVCSKRDEWMTCIRHVQKTSTHPIDKLVFKFLIPDNIEKIFDFSCEETKLFEKHASCIVASFSLSATSNTSCLRMTGETMAANFTEMYKASVTSPATLDQIVTAICKSFEPVPECMAPTFDRCNEELASKFRQMSTWFLDACGSDSSVTLKQGGDGKSHGNRYLATVAMVVLTLLTSMNFWM